MSAQPVFFNRELSWLAFNRRVLEQALDRELPLLERLRFLAITASNLDEFFMIRVGGLQTLRQQGDERPDAAGLKPSQQLAAIRQAVLDMVRDQYRCWMEEIEPGLASAGIRRLQIADLSAEQDAFVERLFEYEMFPLLTPMAIDLDEPFPALPGLTLHLCVRLKALRGTDHRVGPWYPFREASCGLSPSPPRRDCNLSWPRMWLPHFWIGCFRAN